MDAAPLLLGWIIVKGDMRARIVETEAYRADDPACHAFGRSKMKNMALWASPGLAYVYFTYGHHWMLNVVAHEEGDPAAVLIRAAEPLEGIDEMYSRRLKAVKDEDLLSGPGKLAAALDIDSRQNLIDLLDPSSELHLKPAEHPAKIVDGVRIGIAEGKGHEIPWRFIDADRMRWASKPWPRP